MARAEADENLRDWRLAGLTPSAPNNEGHDRCDATDRQTDSYMHAEIYANCKTFSREGSYRLLRVMGMTNAMPQLAPRAPLHCNVYTVSILIGALQLRHIQAAP